MQFNLSNPLQFSHVMAEEFFIPFYQELNATSQKSSVYSWLSPVITIVDMTAFSILTIGAIAEYTIKGIGNLFKAMLTFNLNYATDGIKLLSCATILAIIAAPLTLFRALATMTAMIFDPITFTQTQVDVLLKVFPKETQSEPPSNVIVV